MVPYKIPGKIPYKDTVHDAVQDTMQDTGQDTVQDTDQVTGQVTDQVNQLIAVLSGEMGRNELQAALKLVNRSHFTTAYLKSALAAGLIEMTLRTNLPAGISAIGARPPARPWLIERKGRAARMNTAPIVSKVWSFCHTLRDDGVGYGDYLEQLTYLIFLKMADEYAKPPYNRDVGIPAKHKWTILKSKKGAELEDHYVATLRALAPGPACWADFHQRPEQDSGPGETVSPHRHG